jgi:hypothetical protein
MRAGWVVQSLWFCGCWHQCDQDGPQDGSREPEDRLTDLDGPREPEDRARQVAPDNVDAKFHCAVSGGGTGSQ